MRVLFEEIRSFLEDHNGQVPNARETPWFWMFLALPHWPGHRLAVLLDGVDDEHLPG